MTVLTPAELLLLRSGHPHASKFYLTIFRPEVVYVGQVTGAPAKGARFITVADVSGDIADIEDGYTIKVLDADGNLVSKRRYRSRIGQVLKIDENTVVWSNDYTLHIYKQRELWTKYPYIDAASEYTFYKDYDVSYSSQNRYIPPVAIAGHPKVGFLDGDSITFDLDGSASYIMSSLATSILSYLWSCDGGIIADDDAAVTTITFTAAGEYMVKLTVTDNLGVSQSTYRMIRVHARTGAEAPITNFEVDSIENSWSIGGSSARIVVRDSDLDYIEDGSFVIIWSETWYGDTKQNIGTCGNIRLAGYVLSDSTDKTIKQNEVSFEIGTLDAIMKKMQMFSVSLEAVPSGSADITWYQFPYDTLTVARAAHHLWKWHSTLLEITDVYLPVDNLVKLPACDDMTDGNLYTLLDWAYSNGIFAKVICDQAGSVHLVRDVLMLGDAGRNAVDTVMEILDIDRRAEEDIQIDRSKEAKAAYVLASGVAMIAGVATPLMSQAPGAIPNNVGEEMINVERLALLSQADLNELTGRLYAISNSEISELRLSFAGDYFVDVSEQCWYTLHIPASYTKRGIDVDVRMLCRDVSYRISIASGTIFPSCVFDVDVDSEDGETVEYVEAVEQPYAPITPYIPYIPYLPGITPIYPIVPSSPYPYPVGAPTTLPPKDTSAIPTIDILCKDDPNFEANGPYPTGLTGVITTRILYPIRFWLRGVDSVNYTHYTINGLFQTVNGVTGDFVADTADGFYTVYACDCTGTRVATGIHDSMSADGYQRNGHFEAPAGVNICYIEIVLTDNSATLVSIAVSEAWLDTAPPSTFVTGIFSYTDTDGVVVFQYAHAVGAVSGGFSGFDANIRIGIWAIYDKPAAMWFDIDANIYSSVYTSDGSHSKWKSSSVLNVWDGTFTAGLHYVHKVKANSGASSGVWVVGYHNINPAAASGSQWVTIIGTLTPRYGRITIDDFLLWNVCRYDE